MPYREKVAWLYLFAFAVTYGPYFALARLDPPGALPDLEQLGRFALTAIVQMVLLLGGFMALRLRTPAEDRTGADERDRAIELRARRLAYYVLLVGVILTGVVMPFLESGWEIVNATLAAIVVAELVQSGMTVRLYRAGWHD